MIVSASIVIYNEDKEVLKKAILSFLNLNFEKELVIVDNSKDNKLETFCSSFKDTTYLKNKKNLGFGRSHNMAFLNLEKESDIHIVINPDIYFDKNIENMLLWFYSQKSISLCTPAVYYPDGRIQKIVRNIPTLIDLFQRKFNMFNIFDKKIKQEEWDYQNYSSVTDIPFAHGCFLMFRSNVFKKLNGFDERFFMYMEDVDIFIRAKEYGKTVINNKFKVFHEYRRSSSKNLKLFVIHTISVMKFFMKYKMDYKKE